MVCNPYAPVRAELERVVQETPTIKTYTLRPERSVPFEAGQFVELTVPGVGEAPFTPSSPPSVADTLEITIMRVGRVTGALDELEPGAELAVRGPLGRAYPVDRFKGRQVVLAGGGCGVGPLRALMYWLVEEIDDYERVFVRYGARSANNLVFREAMARGWVDDSALDVKLTCDVAGEGWTGHVGVLPTILDEKHLPCDPANAVAVMCGPPLMMKFTSQKLLERGFAPEDIYLSLEKNMSCGIGKCGHCRLGRYYICHDGPVFSFDQLPPYPRPWED
jgi:NAD(P)H-flavin reductase